MGMSTQIKCQLLGYTPNAEEIITKAGKLCYSAVGVDEIGKKQTPETIEKFINMLASMGHESPMEHVSFTFAVEGISRACTHQLVRHRLASYSQQSQRYVNLDRTFNYIVPNNIKKNPYALDLFNTTLDNAFEYYVLISRELIKCNILKFFNKDNNTILLDELEEMEILMKKEYKKEYNAIVKSAIEDARAVLPNACETKIVFTMNARTLLNFFKHRHCKRAQEEIRGLATIMLEQVREVAPTLFRYAGASCQTGKCPEGAMCCGNPYPKIEKQ